MDRENAKAKKHIENKPQIQQQASHGVHQGAQNVLSGPKGGSAALNQNLDSFFKGKGLIIGEKVDHVAANQQLIRAEELRELIGLGQEEFFNIFEMVPQTPQDVYYGKVTAGVVKTAIVSTSDENIDRDVQTEDLGAEDKFNQAPEDIMISYEQTGSKSGAGGYKRKKKRENEALQLEKFMQRAGPVMEQVLEENE